jgi:hypothetical protein
LSFRGVSVKSSSVEQVFGKKGRRRYRHCLEHEDKGGRVYDILKKFDAFSGMCLEIKEKLGEAYEVGNQIRIVVADISISTV